MSNTKAGAAASPPSGHADRSIVSLKLDFPHTEGPELDDVVLTVLDLSSGPPREGTVNKNSLQEALSHCSMLPLKQQVVRIFDPATNRTYEADEIKRMIASSSEI
jgi:hypothetical protein